MDSKVGIGESAAEPPDHCIAIGNVECTEDYQLAFYVEGFGQIHTVMTPQEHGIVARVVRRAWKEYIFRKETEDDTKNRENSLEETGSQSEG